tara:strand:+ start:528 stop:746 length:219 start_codon:yes stop_codon:yes gene_type:complete
MTKFILIMFLCSNIAGNECKLITTSVDQFDTYHECAYFGYDYSSALLKEFNIDFVDQYRTYTAFSCKEQSTI